jgi:hypothetical protein
MPHADRAPRSLFPPRIHSTRIGWTALLALMNLSMQPTDPWRILTHRDFELEQRDRRRGPELSSPLGAYPAWQSYNEWRCMDSRDVNLECTDIDEGNLQVPTLSVQDQGKFIEFSLDPEPDRDCAETLAEWSRVLEHSEAFCAYAAYLQELPTAEDGMPRELWITSGLRSLGSQWWDPWNTPALIPDTPPTGAPQETDDTSLLVAQ